MSSGGRFKLTIKKTGSQQAAQQPSNGVTSSGSGEQRPKAPSHHSTGAIASAAANARPSPSGSVPRPGGLTLKGASRPAAPRPSTGTPGGPRIMLKGASSSGHATPAASTPQQAAVQATPASAPGAGPRRLALKGQSSRPPASAGTPAAAAAAAGTPASAPKSAPPAAGGFATPRPAAVAGTPASARTPATAGGSAQPAKKLGIRLKGSSSTPASAGGPARVPSATPGSLPRPAATPGSAGHHAAAGAASAPPKPRLTLNKSRGRPLSQQHSMQHSQSSMHSQLQPVASQHGGGEPLQPVAYKQEQAAQQQPYAAADYYSSGQGLHGYDSSHAAGYGALPESSGFMSHDYSSAGAAAAADPAAGMYGSGADYGAAAGAPMPAPMSSDPAAAAAGGMYGAGHDHSMYGMGVDPAAAAATAMVDYSAQAYYPQAGQKRGRSGGSARAAAAPSASPLGPRSKRPKPGQFRDNAEEDADEDFNPKAERARAMNRGGGGSGGITTARAVKSKGPSGARAPPAWQARPAVPGRTGAKAAAAQKAAHKAAQDAARRMHPHAAHRAGGGHVSAVVPMQRARHHALPGMGAAGAAAGAPRSPVLGEDALMTGADAAAAFARSAAAQDAAAAMDLDLDGVGGNAAAAAGGPAVPAAAPQVVPRAAGGGRGGQRGQQPRRTVEQVLAELHAQVEYVEETHPPTRESLNMLLAAVDKRDKFRFFGKPVTDDQAPGYSSIIQNPMDLSKMKQKVESGMYASWNELMADIILMCANAKVYNHQNTKPHKEADVIFKYSVKYVKSFKQGKTNLRGAVAAAVRNANNDAAAAAAGNNAAGGGTGNDANNNAAAGAAGAPSGPVTRALRRGNRRGRDEEAAPAANKRQRGSKFKALSQSTASDWSLASTLDGDSARDTYKSRPRLYAASWGGLADGASPEGVAYGGHGKPILRCVAGHAANLPPDMYLGSLSRFVAGAGPAVEKLVLQLMGSDLGAKLIPIPGVTPTQVPHQAAGLAAHRPVQQQQQHMAAAAGQHRGQPPLQPVQALAQQQGLQQAQQQGLAGLFGGAGALGGVGQGQNMLAGLSPAQLAQLHQHQQLLQRQAQAQAQQGQQQFVPGPQHLAQAMNMGRAPVPMPAKQA